MNIAARIRGIVFRTAILFLAVSFAVERAIAANAIILETWPATPAELAPLQPFYVRVSYESSEPVRIRVEGYRNGEQTTGARSNISMPNPAGSGEGVAWVAHHDGVEVDELRVMLYNVAWKRISEHPFPARANWSSAATVAGAAEPEWVGRLEGAQQAAMSAAGQHTGDLGWGDVLIMLIFWCVPGYFLLQILTVVVLNGGRRKLALLPLLVTVPAGFISVTAMIAGSNLWPIWMIFLSPFACLFLVALLLVPKKRPTPVARMIP